MTPEEIRKAADVMEKACRRIVDYESNGIGHTRRDLEVRGVRGCLCRWCDAMRAVDAYRDLVDKTPPQPIPTNAPICQPRPSDSGEFPL